MRVQISSDHKNAHSGVGLQKAIKIPEQIVTLQRASLTFPASIRLGKLSTKLGIMGIALNEIMCITPQARRTAAYYRDHACSVCDFFSQIFTLTLADANRLGGRECRFFVNFQLRNVV